MATAALSVVSAHLRRAAQPTPSNGDSHGALLSRFVNQHDEDAFATLVHRLGPMIFGVCRRITGDTHLAEDAFQATFLVLARRAGDIKPREAVRAWLYGVAVRTAREAIAMSNRRRSRESTMSTVPDVALPATERIDAETLRVLDEEIANLSEHLRAAVVLCELDGLSRKDAAVKLGVPEGTLSSRLAKARRLLAARLRRRSFGVPAAGITALFAMGACGERVRAALEFSASRLAGSSPVAPAVSKIAQGVFRTMLLKKLIAGGALSIAIVVVCLTAIPATRGDSADEKDTKSPTAQAPSPAPNSQAPAPAKASPASPNRIFFMREDTLYSIAPDGKDERRVPLPANAGLSLLPSLNGRKVAYWDQADDGNERYNLFVHEVGSDQKPRQVSLPAGITFLMFCWSPDANEINLSTGKTGERGARHYRLDVKSMKLTELDILRTHLVEDWSRDGKHLLTTAVGDGAEWLPASLHLMNLDGTEFKLVTNAKNFVTSGKLSPDGKRVLCLRDGKMCVVEVGRPESVTEVAGASGKPGFDEFDWSPDGRRIVFRSSQSDKPEDASLIVADPDGKNATVIRTSKDGPVGKVFWR